MQPPACDVRPLTRADAVDCDAIVASLPYHFGDEEGRRACAAAVREGPGYVACLGERTVGFLTWRRWFDSSAEITWMAVHADHRRRGIGGVLLDSLVDDLPGEVRHLVVTTLSESTPEPADGDTYAGTRRFYAAGGFEPVWEPRGWWNERNQAVVMIRRVGRT